MSRGTILPYSVGTAPQNWLLCDGSAISRNEYDQLFDLIGTTYGVGDGSSTFNLPDLRSRMIIGLGQGAGLTNRVLGATNGEETHTLTTAEMPTHNHGVTDPGHNHGITDPGHTHTYGDTYRTGNQNTDNVFGSETAANESSTTETKSTGSSVTSITINNNTTGITTNNNGSGNAHNVMNPFLVLNYIIKF